MRRNYHYAHFTEEEIKTNGLTPKESWLKERKLESDSQVSFLTPDLEYKGEQHRFLIKASANLFEFHANSGSIL